MHTCRLCGITFSWPTAVLQGYQGPAVTGGPPLELRSCPGRDCKNTLAELVTWELLGGIIRAIPDRVARSAALAIESSALPRQERVKNLFPCPHGKTIGERCLSCEQDSASFKCDHGRTLDEVCRQCGRDLDAEKVSGRHTAQRRRDRE